MNGKWGIAENELYLYPFNKVLTYNDEEVPLDQVVDLLNNISDLYWRIGKVEDKLKKYDAFFELFKELCELPNDLEKELMQIHEQVDSLSRAEGQMSRKLYKYGLR